MREILLLRILGIWIWLRGGGAGRREYLVRLMLIVSTLGFGTGSSFMVMETADADFR